MPELFTSIHAIAIDGVAPDWVHLIPTGAFRARDGRGFHLKDADEVIAASKALMMDLPIDYDHAIDFGDKSQPKPAAGWISAFEVRDDGIWGKVEWTPAAAEKLKAKEYRFMSPVFQHTKSGEVVRILRAGLTNSPALVLKAVASQEGKMDEFLNKLREALGLAADTDQDAVIARMSEIVAASNNDGGASVDKTKIAVAAGLAAEASADDVVKAVAALKAGAGSGGNPDPTKYVSVAEFDKVNRRLADVEGGRARDKAEDAVDAAIEAGKLTPAQRDWAVGYCQRQPEEFAVFAAAQPVIVAAGRSAPVGDPPKGAEGLTADELAVCRQLGIAAADFKKTHEADRQGDAR